jgi:hypothetical protein
MLTGWNDDMRGAAVNNRSQRLTKPAADGARSALSFSSWDCSQWAAGANDFWRDTAFPAFEKGRSTSSDVTSSLIPPPSLFYERRQSQRNPEAIPACSNSKQTRTIA